MTIECAISKAYKHCERLFGVIEYNEAKWQCMDGKNRNTMGMIRCLMFTAGVSRDKLPEMPFLDPAHLEAFNRRKEVQRAEHVEIIINQPE